MRDAFSDCHPVVNFIFYIGALVMGMCFLHPLFFTCSLVLSMAYFIWLKRSRGSSFLLGMLLIWAAMALINPFFNTLGETVLFTYWKGRPYTLEALYYGISLGAVFVTVLTWFATYNEVMTGDKFLYCFGRLTPSAALILTMVLRLVPGFRKKTEQIGGARRCIGKSAANGTKPEQVEHGLTLISALTSWALEGGVVMADSMRSRGFGSGKRTSFSIYHMRKSDKLLLLFMPAWIFLIFVCALQGGMEVSFVPQMQITGIDNIWTLLGITGYFLFLSIPTAVNVMEELQWRILRSGI